MCVCTCVVGGAGLSASVLMSGHRQRGHPAPSGSSKTRGMCMAGTVIAGVGTVQMPVCSQFIIYILQVHMMGNALVMMPALRVGSFP